MGEHIGTVEAASFGSSLDTIGVICDLTARLYAAAPDEPTLTALRTLDADENLALSPGDQEWVTGLRLIAGYCRRGAAETLLLDAIGDHSRLFVGPLHVLAPPWSSVYLDNGLLFGPTAQRVGRLYREFGLQVPRPGQEPEDHIAFELAFLALLNRRAAAQLRLGRQTESSKALAVASAFCSQYLEPWVEPFLTRVETCAETELYCGLARVTRGLVVMEERCLSEIAELLDAK